MSEDLTISGVHHKKVRVEVIVADVSARHSSKRSTHRAASEA